MYSLRYLLEDKSSNKFVVSFPNFCRIWSCDRRKTNLIFAMILAVGPTETHYIFKLVLMLDNIDHMIELEL